MDYTIEIENYFDLGFIVYFSDDGRGPDNFEDYKADTLAEAYLWIAKRFHKLGMDEFKRRELQDRINAL